MSQGHKQNRRNTTDIINAGLKRMRNDENMQL